MNKTIAYIICFLVFFSTTRTESADASFARYQEYIKKFGKKFSSLDDLTAHYEHYVENISNIATLNAANKQDEGEDNIFGETEFSDMNSEDFQRQYLTFTAPVEKIVDKEATTEAKSNDNDQPETGRNLQADEEEHLRNLQSVPSSFDWRTKGVVGVVKNQGTCGDCWAFGTTRALSDRFCVASNKTIDVVLSP